MDETHNKRGYRNDLEFVEAGFRACWQNANDLIAGSKSLMQQGFHAPALSLAVLALEEVGKMCATDGLLFARPDDDKSKRFGKSQRDHDTKLGALSLIALFISNISRVDPRHGKGAYLHCCGSATRLIGVSRTKKSAWFFNPSMKIYPAKSRDTIKPMQ